MRRFVTYRSGYCDLVFQTDVTCTLQLPSKFSVAIRCPVVLYNHRSLFILRVGPISESVHKSGNF